MTISAPFSTVGEADNAYFGTEDDGDGGGGGDGDGGDGGDGGGGGGDQDTAWGDLQESETLGSGWVLAYQDEIEGDRRRWFVFRMPGDVLQALKSSGQVYEAKETDTLTDLPHYRTEDEARAAYQAWAEENDDGNEETGDDEWGKWNPLRESDPWHIYTRAHQSEDRQQYLVAGKRDDGTTVYLAPGGGIVEEPHIYDSVDAFTKALEAYYEQAGNGEIPEEERPNGDAPSTEKIRESVRQSSSSSKSSELIEKLGGKKVTLAAIGAAGLIAINSMENGGS